MARGKKNEKKLTIEERLKQALVPAEEQPYSVPENWCWVKVGALSTLHRGVSYKKHDVHFAKQENDCLILRGGNINEGSIDVDQSDNVYVDMALVDKEQLIQEYDIVIVSSTGSTKIIGRAGISHDSFPDVAFGAFLTLIRPTSDKLKPFIAYYFQTDLYRERIRNLAAGVNINNIRADYITESSVPFPTLAEQQRIVDRIESLFAKLDEAKEKAQAVVDGFETRRAAILHKAFTGELTAQWRKENKSLLEAWKSVQFGELLSDVRLGLVKGKDEQSNEKKYAYFKMNNISTDGLIDYNFIRVDATEAEAQLYCLDDGDFLFNTRNSHELVGKNCVWHSKGNDCVLYNNNLMRIRFFENVHPQYISYFFYSTKGQAELNKRKKNTTNIAAIYAKDLNQINIIIPPYNEQAEIVRILDALFAKEQQAKETAEAVLDQIEAMKKSILARAFRGELGTNDPAEESAEELLKQTLKERQIYECKLAQSSNNH